MMTLITQIPNNLLNVVNKKNIFCISNGTIYIMCSFCFDIPPPEARRKSKLLYRTIFCGIYNIVVGQRVRVYRNVSYHRRVDWSVLIPLLSCCLAFHWQTFHMIEHVPPIQHPSEYRVDVIQVRLSFVRDEELCIIIQKPAYVNMKKKLRIHRIHNG